MGTIDQITYRARNDSTGIIDMAATSIQDQAESDRWLRRLEPWLRIGKPPGRAYLDFGTQLALIRWYAEAASHFDWQYALVLVGHSDVLTSGYALELPDPDSPTLHQGGGRLPLERTERGPGHDAIEALARSQDAMDLLIPLLAHALRGERRMTMPWTDPPLPEAVMWGLVGILEMIGDAQPVSFLTYASSASRDPDTPGLFVSFRTDATTMLPPDPGFRALAADLAARFADDPAKLRQQLAQHGMLEPADHVGRISRLLNVWPGVKAQNATDRHGGDDRRDAPGQAVMCPMCLHEIEDWNTLGYRRWDPGQESYVQLAVPPDVNPTQRARYLRGAHVRCPASQGHARTRAHYLPADYSRFGPPVVLGFVGLTKSGKSHLLASMVGAIGGRELESYGIFSSPLDHAWHRRFMDTCVSPLLKHDKVLPSTREGGVIDCADAFVMRHRGGPERVVALFDVAGADLARLDETKQFLWIANGLFFVIDPDRMSAQWAEDETFSTPLSSPQSTCACAPATTSNRRCSPASGFSSHAASSAAIFGRTSATCAFTRW